MTKEDLEELSKKMRFNLTALQAQLSDMQRAIAALVPPDEPTHRCFCGWSGRSTYQFQEHRYRQHDGAVPEHYLAAERAAGLEPEERETELVTANSLGLDALTRTETAVARPQGASSARSPEATP